MDHAIRIVAFSVGFRLRTIDTPLNPWMQEHWGKQAGCGQFSVLDPISRMASIKRDDIFAKPAAGL